MKDQYGQVAPADLVVVDFEPADLTENELRAFDGLDWYQPDRWRHQGYQAMVLVSQAALAGCCNHGHTGIAPADTGLGTLRGVDKIDHCLHRWSVEDGFYHA